MARLKLQSYVAKDVQASFTWLRKNRSFFIFSFSCAVLDLLNRWLNKWICIARSKQTSVGLIYRAYSLELNVNERLLKLKRARESPGVGAYHFDTVVVAERRLRRQIRRRISTRKNNCKCLTLKETKPTEEEEDCSDFNSSCCSNTEPADAASDSSLADTTTQRTSSSTFRSLPDCSIHILK